MQNIEILYEDKELLVCVKPAGLAVQTKKLTEPDLESELKRQRQSDIYVVHRLDQPVKGLMVFAKTKAAAAALSSQVQQEGGMHKEYIARVFKTDAASDTLPSGTLTDWLLKDGKTNSSRVAAEGAKDAKRAELFCEELEQDKETALLRIRLATGRHHQIRVQLSSRGFPILGDTKYGNKNSRAYAREHQIHQLCLTACRIAFTHPKSGKRMEFTL